MIFAAVNGETDLMKATVLKTGMIELANLVQEEGIGGIITLVDALESQQMYREDPESWKEELEEVDGNEEELEFVRDIEKAVENLPKGSDREEQLQKCRRIMEEFRWMNEKGEAVK